MAATDRRAGPGILAPAVTAHRQARPMAMRRHRPEVRPLPKATIPQPGPVEATRRRQGIITFHPCNHCLRTAGAVTPLPIREHRNTTHRDAQDRLAPITTLRTAQTEAALRGPTAATPRRTMRASASRA